MAATAEASAVSLSVKTLTGKVVALSAPLAHTATVDELKRAVSGATKVPVAMVDLRLPRSGGRLAASPTTTTTVASLGLADGDVLDMIMPSFGPAAKATTTAAGGAATAAVSAPVAAASAPKTAKDTATTTTTASAGAAAAATAFLTASASPPSLWECLAVGLLQLKPAPTLQRQTVPASAVAVSAQAAGSATASTVTGVGPVSAEAAWPVTQPLEVCWRLSRLSECVSFDGDFGVAQRVHPRALVHAASSVTVTLTAQSDMAEPQHVGECRVRVDAVAAAHGLALAYTLDVGTAGPQRDAQTRAFVQRLMQDPKVSASASRTDLCVRFAPVPAHVTGAATGGGASVGLRLVDAPAPSSSSSSSAAAAAAAVASVAEVYWRAATRYTVSLTFAAATPGPTTTHPVTLRYSFRTAGAAATAAAATAAVFGAAAATAPATTAAAAAAPISVAAAAVAAVDPTAPGPDAPLVPDAPTVQRLVDAALAAKSRAYAPYSHFRVGSAVLTRQGDVITGANVENACYGLTQCAERVALQTAVSQGHVTDVVAVLTATDLTDTFKSPCGACLQVMLEFGGRDLWVGACKPDGTVGPWRRVRELAPYAFSAADLRKPRAIAATAAVAGAGGGAAAASSDR